MELLAAHGKALTGFDEVVGRIAETDWARPTPCSEWTVRDLLNHLVYEQLWVPELLAGTTVAEIGDRFDGDVLGDDPVGRWRSASRAAREAWLGDGVLERDVHLGRGPVPATQYCWEMTLDLAVHGWDLARGIDAPSPLGTELAETLLPLFEEQVSQFQDLGIFDPPVPVPDTAGAPEKLLALSGRDPGQGAGGG
jgi:uncharacterized protein (TIGR03086 family)